MKFTKSLKFKLTVWYSLILSLFCIAFVFSINVWLTNYMNSWQSEGMGWGFMIVRVDRPRWRALSEEQRDLVMESRLEDLENIRRVSIYMVIPLVLLSFGGGYVIAGFMLRPLEKLNEEIKRKEANTLDKEIQFEDKGDEISELIKSFNRMSGRLGKSFESQKQFVENASHELKTPLSVIQANLDTVLDDEKITEKELKELLTNSKKQVKVMDELTEDLLLLSMISSDVKIKKENIDVGKLIKDVVKDLKTLSEDSGIDIKIGKINDIKIEGNRVLLSRAISNIIENGIRYSKGSMVSIDVKKEKDVFKILIEDDGVGIPEKRREEIFERFNRLDKGRSRKEGGSGLGLSIARDITKVHDGLLYVDPKYSKGARFVFEFKLS
jgi:signal transduction histidine kinase